MGTSWSYLYLPNPRFDSGQLGLGSSKSNQILEEAGHAGLAIC